MVKDVENVTMTLNANPDTAGFLENKMRYHPETSLTAYISTSGRPEQTGFGIVLRNDQTFEEQVWGGTSSDVIGCPYVDDSNHAIALIAAIELLETLSNCQRITVITSNQYLAYGAQSWLQGWKTYGWKTKTGEPVKHRMLWERIDELSQGLRVTWKYEKHKTHPELTRAAELARQMTRTAA